MAAKKKDTSPLPHKVLEIVRAIPKRRVLTYGQVALLAGVPRGARQVGRILYQFGGQPGIPWQRVINRYGGLSTYKIGHGELQRELLEAEGVEFTKDGTVPLERYQWRPTPKALQRLELPVELAFEINARLPFSK